MKRVKSSFMVPGGEICAGCLTERTNMWSSTKDVPVCNTCAKTKKVKELPNKSIWWDLVTKKGKSKSKISQVK